MEGQGEFEFEVTTQNTGSFEWTLRTEHDEDAYENWDNLWADIEMEVEEQVSSRWEDELDPGYGGHNPGFGDGFEVTLELTKEGAKEHGVEQEEAWVDWTAGSSSPWYSAEGREETQRMTRAEAEALADKVVKLVTPYVDRVEVCGSYRRGSPRPGDLDVVIIPKKGVTLPEIVKAIKPTEVHWMGEKKAQVLIDDHNVDFRTSSPKGWGAALLYFTGPAGYNIGMRVRAKKMGMKLNEYGIFDRNTNAYLGGATEDEIYTVLGKTLKLPVMRAEAVINSCSHCGAKGELMTMPTRMGHKKTFCGPVCLYKWQGRQRLAAEDWQLVESRSRKVEMLKDVDYAIYTFTREAKEHSQNGEPQLARMLREDSQNMKKLKRMILKDQFKKAMQFASVLDSSPREYAPRALWDIWDSESEVFEAPRAAFANADQAAWEKSYDIRAKKPLTKFLKERMGGNKPSDNEREYYGGVAPLAKGVTKDEAKLIQGYATVMKMCESRFKATNGYDNEASYKIVTNGAEAYATSWNPKYNRFYGAGVVAGDVNYLEQAVIDLHALAALDDKGKTEYMAKNVLQFQTFRLSFMREFLRYYDITMTGPYKDIQMVATDRAPYSIQGGYGDVDYTRRNPYYFGHEKKVSDVFSYEEGKSVNSPSTLTIGTTKNESAFFTRMTKMRPYTLAPAITNSTAASTHYSTDGGSGWSRRGQGSQEFQLTPVVLRKPASSTQRNPTPGYSSQMTMEGWRWDVEDWETRKSAPYRYATMVAIPNGEALQRIYTGGEAKIFTTGPINFHGSHFTNSARGGKVLQRNEIVDTINICIPLLKDAVESAALARVNKEKAESKQRALRGKNQALTELEDITKDMMKLLSGRVSDARAHGVSEDDIYQTLEMTQYDLEQLVHEWEPDDYMAEG